MGARDNEMDMENFLENCVDLAISTFAKIENAKCLGGEPDPEDLELIEILAKICTEDDN